MVYAEARLKSFNKPDLIKLLLRPESEMNFDKKEIISEIRHIITQLKKVEADVALVKNGNDKLVNQLIETERQYWTNAQYSRREYLRVVGIHTSIPNDSWETNTSKVFDKLGIQA